MWVAVGFTLIAFNTQVKTALFFAMLIVMLLLNVWLYINTVSNTCIYLSSYFKLLQEQLEYWQWCCHCWLKCTYRLTLSYMTCWKYMAIDTYCQAYFSCTSRAFSRNFSEILNSLCPWRIRPMLLWESQ